MSTHGPCLCLSLSSLLYNLSYLDIQANCVELHKAARSLFDAVFTKHSMLMEESESAISRLNHREGMKSLEFKTLPSRQLLKCAEDDLRDLQYRDARNACRDGTADNRLQRALPAEIIQYIVSLAYDNETLKAYLYQPDRTGARSLAPTHTAYPLIHNFLLSSTTLQVDYIYDRARVTEYCLNHTSPLKLQITLRHFSLKRGQFLPAILQHTSRVKSLTLYYCSDLDCLMPAFPYLEHLALTFHDEWIGSPNWTKINQLLQELGPPKLRSSTLPFCFLAGLTSSGFLRNVISLSIYFGDDNQCPQAVLDQCLCTLSQLQKLTSLELRGTIGLKRYSASDGKCYRSDSLKRLQVSCYGWKDASHLVFRFSACDLKEISFRNTFGCIDIGVFACNLSDTFPHLGRLKIPTTEAYKLLHRDHGDSGNAWNFLLLHTLDFDKRSYSSEDVSSLIDVLRDRAGPEAHTLGVVPINCLFLDKLFGEDCKLKYALIQLVPNVVLV